MTVSNLARVNQRRIASNLSLSAATVSRSLRGHPDITAETRERVLEEANRIGYFSSRAVTAGKAVAGPVVGVLVANSTRREARHDLSSMMTAGASMAASERSATTVVHYVPGDGSDLLEPGQEPAAIQPGRVDGLLLMHGFAPEVTRHLAARLPCVTLAHFVHVANADHVGSDAVHAMATLTDHLFSLGHQRIGFICRQNNSSINRERFAAYLQSMQRLGLPCAPDHEVRYPITASEEEQKHFIQKLASVIRSGVRAWCCDSDGTAYRILRELSKMGLNVPDDFSLVGYDGLDPLFGCPQMTTVRVPFIELGAAAMRQVLTRIESPTENLRQILIRCAFVSGATTAAPPAK